MRYFSGKIKETNTHSYTFAYLSGKYVNRQVYQVHATLTKWNLNAVFSDSPVAAFLCTVNSSRWINSLCAVTRGGSGRGRQRHQISGPRDMWLRLSESCAPFLAKHISRTVRVVRIS